MVLWEIALGTAFFLGLKRTYSLALRLQRRIISPKQPKIRQFVQRRTRAVFDVALKVHRNIQEREVGRNLRNFIPRWLDRIKPTAEIRGTPPAEPTNGSSSSASVTKHATNALNQEPPGYRQFFRRDFDRHFFTSSNIWPKPFPTIAKMMRQPKSAGSAIHHRHISISAAEVVRSKFRVNWSDGVIRKDIMQWMQQN